ncbi:MAG: hypothetical protein Q9193_002874 [Seirophora villosa]
MHNPTTKRKAIDDFFTPTKRRLEPQDSTRGTKLGVTDKSLKLVREDTAVPGLSLCRDFISPTEEQDILAFLNDPSKCTWRTDLSRRTMHFGGTYCIMPSKKEFLVRSKPEVLQAPEMPQDLHWLVQRLIDSGVYDDGRRPQFCIVNEYTGNLGISAHTENFQFGEPVVGLSLLSACPIRFHELAEAFDGSIKHDLLQLARNSHVKSLEQSSNGLTHGHPRDGETEAAVVIFTISVTDCMGLINRKNHEGSVAALPSPPSSDEKGSFTDNADVARAEDDPESSLHRGLKSRQITMIAIGGAIGTGLIIGTGSALAKAGPLSILISYTIVGFIVYMVMCALGEMAAYLPIQSGFTGYANRFCDPALGFSLGYTYWFKYIIVTPNQLTAAALVIQYWVPRERVNPGVFIAVFLVVIILINYLGIKYFGEIEFWLSSVKVLTIVGLLILSLVLVLGGGPDHDRKGFRYWRNPGSMKTLYGTGDKGRFLGLWSTFVTATFAYLGTELVGVTVGEAQNPRRVIPRAIKLTFWRIVIFYVLSVLLIGMLVPYNSSALSFATKQTTGASASPFVVAMIESGIGGLPGFLNALILIFVFSAANTDLYIATRTLYGLAKEGNSHRIFAKTDRRGVPIYALGLSALIACIAFLNVADDSRKVFGYFVNLVTIFGLLTWISILVTHIYFVKARQAQGVEKHQLSYVAPFGLYGTYFALGFCIVIALFKNFDVFVHVEDRAGGENFDYNNFITGYLGIPLYLIMIFGYKIFTRAKGRTPLTADLITGKEAIDREEEEFLANKAAKQGGKQTGGWFYRHFVAWLL